MSDDNFWGEAFLGFLAVTFLVVIAGFFMGYPLMLLWNWLAVGLFNFATINFWQAVGLYILSGLLFKSSNSSNSKS